MADLKSFDIGDGTGGPGFGFRREVAPYLGVVRDYRRSVDSLPWVPSRSGTQTRLVAGVRLWF